MIKKSNNIQINLQQNLLMILCFKIITIILFIIISESNVKIYLNL